VQNAEHISEVISNFECNCEVSSIVSYGSGHINDTYFLKNSNAKGPDYLLQRINHHVFKDIKHLTQNMCMVISHLKSKVLEVKGGNPETQVMTLIATKDGQFYFEDSKRDFWRMFYFLGNTKSYDMIENEKQAFEAGKAFGKFQAMLADLPAGILHEVIPDFHNFEKRLEQLNDARRKDAFNRTASVQPELEYIAQYTTSMMYFQQTETAIKLPRRVIHNDTKFNNVLLNQNDEVQCVIDLDTVMDGYVAYDFGDAIRTIINSSSEDQEDLSKINLNVNLFNAYTKGYLKEASHFITENEVHSLFKGVLLLPFMQAVRFLTDHINGDQYYKIKFEGHNLQRTRAQLQLFKMLEANSTTLQETIIKEMKYFKAENHF
jgi:Ser/Thr protein kinase RdoA (MazF antagonist)